MTRRADAEVGGKSPKLNVSFQPLATYRFWTARVPPGREPGGRSGGVQPAAAVAAAAAAAAAVAAAAAAAAAAGAGGADRARPAAPDAGAGGAGGGAGAAAVVPAGAGCPTPAAEEPAAADAETHCRRPHSENPPSPCTAETSGSHTCQPHSSLGWLVRRMRCTCFDVELM